jgi:hypothetical protein
MSLGMYMLAQPCHSLLMQTNTTPAVELAQTIAARVGGRVVDDGRFGFRVALNDERGTYVARVTDRGEVLRLTPNGGRVDVCFAKVTDF